MNKVSNFWRRNYELFKIFYAGLILFFYLWVDYLVLQGSNLISYIFNEMFNFEASDFWIDFFQIKREIISEFELDWYAIFRRI